MSAAAAGKSRGAVAARVYRADRRSRDEGRVRASGLALAGGGPLGGIYEVGALIALADSLDGIDFNELDVYVGVSSGVSSSRRSRTASRRRRCTGCSSTMAPTPR